ncbi:cupin domain-containing protein [Ahrensia kielensis]|uniref:Cupin domain-containing protein n=1 Tax=Ahrensia kielensis TaxID=76980 RepID=A0ABU9T2S9_9HYPH
MSEQKHPNAVARRTMIHNIAEVPWKEFPAHHGGALSKALAHPTTTGSHSLDYRISTYQPMAYVERHVHDVQEQVYHILSGEGLMELNDEKRVVRKNDVIFIAPGTAHSIVNTGLDDLTFIVATTPINDI